MLLKINIDNCTDNRYLDVCLNFVGQSRDHDAFVEVYNFYAGRVKSYLAQKGLTDGVAEELMSEIMLRVLRESDRFNPNTETASGYIFHIARDHWLTFNRGYQRIEFEQDDPMLKPSST